VQHVIEVVDAAARELLSERGVDDTLDLVVKGALQSVPGAAQAGVSLVSRSGKVTTCAPTDEVVRELDEMQAQLREGAPASTPSSTNPSSRCPTWVPIRSAGPASRNRPPARVPVDGGFPAVLRPR
jgi:hypothetical protein